MSGTGPDPDFAICTAVNFSYLFHAEKGDG